MNYTINLNELLAELREQDEIYQKMTRRREQIRNLTKGLGIYNEVREMLFDDGKTHVSF